MVFNLKEFKEVCSKILTAVDSSDGSMITDTLELGVSDSKLALSVTNREYFAKVQMVVGDVGEFRASVNAGLFLKLVSSLTSENIELSVEDTYHLSYHGKTISYNYFVEIDTHSSFWLYEE